MQGKEEEWGVAGDAFLLLQHCRQQRQREKKKTANAAQSAPLARSPRLISLASAALEPFSCLAP